MTKWNQSAAPGRQLLVSRPHCVDSLYVWSVFLSLISVGVVRFSLFLRVFSLLYKLQSTSLCLSALPDKRSCRSLVALSFAAASLIWVKEVVTLPPCRSLWASDHTNSDLYSRIFPTVQLSLNAQCFEVEQQPNHKNIFWTLYSTFLQTVGMLKFIFWQCCVGLGIKKTCGVSINLVFG